MTDPRDISELFALDPLTLTSEDIDELIEVYRKKRHLFDSGNMSAGKAKTPSKVLAGTGLGDALGGLKI